MLTKDRDKTIAQHFLDKRSYVCFDGREVLYGEDWKARKAELWQRCGGRCEKKVAIDAIICNGWGNYEQQFERCRNEMHDPDHIIKRSKKRDDRLSNLQGLCRLHHELKHPEKEPKWTRRSKAKES